MKLLLDTHIWVWSVADESRLTDTVRRTLDDPAHERWISAISIWEVLILAERGRYHLLREQLDALRCLGSRWRAR